MASVNIEAVTPVVRWARSLRTKYGGAFANATSTTAGGSTTGITLGSANVGVYFGSGAPTISATQGSLYLRTDGSSISTRLYVNTNGSTTWTNVTTAA